MLWGDSFGLGGYCGVSTCSSFDFHVLGREFQANGPNLVSEWKLLVDVEEITALFDLNADRVATSLLRENIVPLVHDHLDVEHIGQPRH